MYFLLAGQCIGQDYEYIQYTTKDGLPSNYVYGAIEDNQGQIWIYTENGLAKFDGYEFTNYGIKEGLPGLDIPYMQKDSVGRIWMNAFKNKPAYLYRDSIFLPIDFPGQFRRLVNGMPYIYSKKRGKFLLKSATKQGTIAKQDSFNVVPGLPWSFYFDQEAQNYIWKRGKKYKNFFEKDFPFLKNPLEYNSYVKTFQIGTSNRYFNYDNNRLSSILFFDIDNDFYKIINLNQKGINPKAFIELSVHDSSVIVNTDAGYLEYDFDANLKDKFLLSKLSSNNQLMRAFKDSKQNIWVGSKNAGLFLIPNQARNSIRLDDSKTMEESFEFLTQSDQGHLFGFTDYSTIYWLKGKNTEVLYQPQTKDRIRSVLKTPMGIIVSTNKETLLLYHEGSQPKVKPLGAVKAFHPTFIRGKADKGEIGMKKVPINLTGATFLLEDNIIYAYCGVVWGAGRIKMNRDQIEGFFIPLDITVFQYHRSEKKLFGGNANNIFLIENEQLIPLDTNGVLSNIKCMFDTPNSLWIGTENGLYQYNLKDNTLLAVIKNVVIRKIKDHKANTIVVATNSGVYILPTDAESQDFIHYDEKDGLPTNEIKDILLYSDSLLYVATANGIHIINQNKKYRTQISANNLSIRSLQMSGTTFAADANISFPHWQNDLDIHYHLNSFASAGDITYQRKLIPIESEWRTGKERQVTYLSLNPGRYTFYLQAQDSYGQEVAMQPITFSINKPFWTTHVFIASAITAVIGLFFLFVHLREKQQRRKLEEEKKLNRRIAELELSALRAQINPHFVFNALGSIQYYIQTKEVESADIYLTKFALLMRKYLDSSKEKLIPIKQELELIRFYTELEKLRFEDLFEVQIEVAQELDLDNTFIPSMLIQPFIENAILHGLDTRRDGKGLLSIKLGIENEVLRIQIEDNGIGFEQAKINHKKGHRSKGMKIIQEKIQTLRESHIADIQINIKNLDDSNAKFPGTQVNLSIQNLELEEA